MVLGRTRSRGVRRVAAACLLALVTALSTVVVPGSAATGVPPASAAEPARLHLVTFGPGTVAGGALPTGPRALVAAATQRRVLDDVGAPPPVYRWTTALDGVAVRLTETQAEQLRRDPAVDLVERNEVLPLASVGAGAAGLPAAGRAPGGSRGGAGVVIAMIDSGLAPDGPVFASTDLGPAPRGFRGECATGPGWDESDCNDKVVGARWYVAGFGADRVRGSASLSPRDDDGHGTALASLAAGNAGVTARAGRPLGRFSGIAPQARLSVYKACWTAPDPEDDGCATADLVTAVDQAVADGVDVINLAAGTTGIDTLELALLGAAEADVVAVAAAGNHRPAAAHSAPWVTTVGGALGVLREGRVELRGGPDLTGAMAARAPVGPARLVLGSDAPAADATVADARVCAPGSLDAGRVAGRVVVCERGRVARVDKSAAVDRADGAGMVLANTRRQSVDPDLHAVPTVHLAVEEGRALHRRLREDPDARVTLAPAGASRRNSVAAWSSPGDPAGLVLKPDLVAPGSGLLAAAPSGWEYISGTSAAAAYTSGVAALLLDRHDWPAATVRSVLATSARHVPGPVLRAGAGRVRPDAALGARLAHEVDPRDYRRWLDGRRLNTSSILLHEGQDRARRTITNVGRRTMYFSSSTFGFARYDVSMRPAAVRLDPGESATYRVRVSGPARRPTDDGDVVWRGADGSTTRVPVLVTR